MANTETQVAAHLRNRIKVAGIKARVRVAPGGGSVQVFPVTYVAEFDADAQRFIRQLAKDNGLTLVRGLPINVEQMTDPHGMTFYVPAGWFEVIDRDGAAVYASPSLAAAKVAGRFSRPIGGFAIRERSL